MASVYGDDDEAPESEVDSRLLEEEPASVHDAFLRELAGTSGSTPVLPGQRLGRYRVISLMGRGGMGSVWSAEDSISGGMVAIKVLDPRIAEQEGMRARFAQEARAAAALKSPNIVRVLNHATEDETPFIVMELLVGESLAVLLEREGKLSPPRVAELFAGIGEGVRCAHATGVVHRDLKPDNVFLARGLGGTTEVKVIDFGIAKVLLGTQVVGGISTATGTRIGSPCYMSPEQALGRKAVDAQADLWAMAVLAYECLLGERPFVGASFADLVIRLCAEPAPVPSVHGPVPAGFDAWFSRATQPKVEDRFAHVDALVGELLRVLA